MIPIAFSALFLGTVAGFVLARRFMLRMLVALICGLIGLIAFVALAPHDFALPGDGHAIVIAAYLVAPPLASGLFGGAIVAWLFRPRTKST